jgi:hypothetical protein
MAGYGHHLALNWNIGEKNQSTDAQRKAFAAYFKVVDPYNHPMASLTMIHHQAGVYLILFLSLSRNFALPTNHFSSFFSGRCCTQGQIQRIATTVPFWD